MIVNVTYLIAPYEEPRILNESVVIENGTVRGLLETLAKRYNARIEKYVLDSTGELRQDVLISVNNRDIRGLNKIKTALKEGDKVTILPPIAGG